MFMKKAEEKKKAKKKQTKYDEKKYSTKEISFLLYSEGNSISDIAAERGLTVNTICKHLEYFVAEGEIDVRDLIPEDTLRQILKTISAHPNTSVGELKAFLPDVDYQDIRFVCAARESGAY